MHTTPCSSVPLPVACGELLQARQLTPQASGARHWLVVNCCKAARWLLAPAACTDNVQHRASTSLPCNSSPQALGARHWLVVNCCKAARWLLAPAACTDNVQHRASTSLPCNSSPQALGARHWLVVNCCKDADYTQFPYAARWLLAPAACTDSVQHRASTSLPCNTSEHTTDDYVLRPKFSFSARRDASLASLLLHADGHTTLVFRSLDVVRTWMTTKDHHTKTQTQDNTCTYLLSGRLANKAVVGRGADLRTSVRHAAILLACSVRLYKKLIHFTLAVNCLYYAAMHVEMDLIVPSLFHTHARTHTSDPDWFLSQQADPVPNLCAPNQTAKHCLLCLTIDHDAICVTMFISLQQVLKELPSSKNTLESPLNSLAASNVTLLLSKTNKYIIALQHIEIVVDHYDDSRVASYPFPDWLREALGTDWPLRAAQVSVIGLAAGWRAACRALIGDPRSHILLASADINLAKGRLGICRWREGNHVTLLALYTYTHHTDNIALLYRAARLTFFRQVICMCDTALAQPHLAAVATELNNLFPSCSSDVLSRFARHLICTVQRYDGNTARLARRSDEALGVRVSVAPPDEYAGVRTCSMPGGDGEEGVTRTNQRASGAHIKGTVYGQLATWCCCKCTTPVRGWQPLQSRRDFLQTSPRTPDVISFSLECASTHRRRHVTSSIRRPRSAYLQLVQAIPWKLVSIDICATLHINYSTLNKTLTSDGCVTVQGQNLEELCYTGDELCECGEQHGRSGCQILTLTSNLARLLSPLYTGASAVCSLAVAPHLTVKGIAMRFLASLILAQRRENGAPPECEGGCRYPRKSAYQRHRPHDSHLRKHGWSFIIVELGVGMTIPGVAIQIMIITACLIVYEYYWAGHSGALFRPFIFNVGFASAHTRIASLPSECVLLKPCLYDNSARHPVKHTDHTKSQIIDIDLLSEPSSYDGNTARLARRSDEALEVRVSVARIASSLLHLGLVGPGVQTILKAIPIAVNMEFSRPSPPSALTHSRLHSSVSHSLVHSSHEHLTRRRPAISSRRPHLTSLAHTRQAASVKDCRPLGCGSASQSHQNILALSLNVSETLAGERRSVTPASLAAVGIHGIPRRRADSHERIVPGREEGEVGLRLRRGAAESAPVAAPDVVKNNEHVFFCMGLFLLELRTSFAKTAKRGTNVSFSCSSFPVYLGTFRSHVLLSPVILNRTQTKWRVSVLRTRPFVLREYVYVDALGRLDVMFYYPGSASLDHMGFYGYHWIAFETLVRTVYDFCISTWLFDEYRPILYPAKRTQNCGNTRFLAANEAVVVQWLDYSPPTKANLVRFLAGSPPHFRILCRTMPLVGEFSRDLPFPPPLHSGAAPYSPRFTLIDCPDLHHIYEIFGGFLNMSCITNCIEGKSSLICTCEVAASKTSRVAVLYSGKYIVVAAPGTAEIWAAVIIEVFTADEGEARWQWSSDGMQGRGIRQIHEKIRRPTASSGTKCGNPGATLPGIEPDSERRGDTGTRYKYAIAATCRALPCSRRATCTYGTFSGSHWTTGLIPAFHWLKPLGPVCMFQPYEQEAPFFARRHTMCQLTCARFYASDRIPRSQEDAPSPTYLQRSFDVVDDRLREEIIRLQELRLFLTSGPTERLLGDLQFPPPVHSLQSPSSALETSLLRATQICSLTCTPVERLACRDCEASVREPRATRTTPGFLTVLLKAGGYYSDKAFLEMSLRERTEGCDVADGYSAEIKMRSVGVDVHPCATPYLCRNAPAQGCHVTTAEESYQLLTDSFALPGIVYRLGAAKFKLEIPC
ncbi:hypothetical protein PR048_022709 [Dryococelus australis]|uniref:Uncharacterized protein n=1 Tax=Dryococelus australis TaxID=614101 RepID=A0ABQ9GS17_9NEOP|nr:hypothetical protein PR048_022709 [Dryococelus australis]